jgi:hypothetical protein
MVRPMTTSRTTAQKLLFAAMIAGSVGVLALALLPMRLAISHFVTEDMFYYLTAARNVADGHIASVDGRSPTNGFHPLWMIICVGIETVFRYRPDVAYHVALVLCAMLFVATGWLLYRIIRRTAGETPALIVGALFLFNYRMATIALCGLETALYGFSIVILLGWLTRRGAEGLRSLRDAVVLGLLLALTYWSRLDAILLGAFVCLGVLLFTLGRPFVMRFVLASVAGVTSVIATLPWFVFSVQSVDTLLPRSGFAIQSWRGFYTNASISFGANVAHILHAKVEDMTEPLNDIGNVLGVWPLTPLIDSKLRYLGAWVCLAALLAVAVVLFRARRAPGLLPFRWIPLYALAHTSYYVVVVRPEIRYLYPVFILMSFYLAVGLQWLIARAREPARATSNLSHVAIAMLCSGVVAGAGAFQYGYGADRYNSAHLGLYDGLAAWIKSDTEQDAIVGGFNCGIVSYYSGRRVVNLDGVMNDAAIWAIRSRTLGHYIDSQGIEYLADIDTEINRFMDEFSGDPKWRAKWHEVYSISEPTFNGTSHMRFEVLRKTTTPAPND